MKKQKGCTGQLTKIAGLLSVMLIGAAYADETLSTCATSCAADLKGCRKQADVTSDREAHPVIWDSSATRTSHNGLANPLITNNELPNSQNDEFQKRRMGRNQECETANNNCLSQCSPEPTPPKISVIFK
jgi:hypothetical protein